MYKMQVVAYLIVSGHITIADYDDDDSPLANVRLSNEAYDDLGEAARLRIGSVLAKAIADELQVIHNQ